MPEGATEWWAIGMVGNVFSLASPVLHSENGYLPDSALLTPLVDALLQHCGDAVHQHLHLDLVSTGLQKVVETPLV